MVGSLVSSCGRPTSDMRSHLLYATFVIIVGSLPCTLRFSSHTARWARTLWGMVPGHTLRNRITVVLVGYAEARGLVDSSPSSLECVLCGRAALSLSPCLFSR